MKPAEITLQALLILIIEEYGGWLEPTDVRQADKGETPGDDGMVEEWKVTIPYLAD